MKKLILALLIFVGATACKDNEVASFGQQTATKIQTENQSLKALRALVYTGSTQIDSGEFSFDGEFIVVGSSRYNLNRLVGYRNYNSGGTQILALYF